MSPCAVPWAMRSTCGCGNSVVQRRGAVPAGVLVSAAVRAGAALKCRVNTSLLRADSVPCRDGRDIDPSPTGRQWLDSAYRRLHQLLSRPFPYPLDHPPQLRPACPLFTPRPAAPPPCGRSCGSCAGAYGAAEVSAGRQGRDASEGARAAAAPSPRLQHVIKKFLCKRHMMHSRTCTSGDIWPFA